MKYHLLGDLKDQPNCHIPEQYFRERDCWVDARGKDMLHIDREANIGWCVKLVTQTHNTRPGYFGDVQNRKIIIGPKAFIAGFATLYNCIIGEGAIIALETVVRSQQIPAYTMWAGNPAVMIKRFDHNTQKWEKV